MTDIRPPEFPSSGDPAAEILDAITLPREEIRGLDAASERKQVRKERRQLLMRSPGFMFGFAILIIWVLCAIAPSWFTKWDDEQPVRVDGATIPRVGPRLDAWFGTDKIGNDVFARIIYGARPVLIVAVTAAVIAVVAGTLLGLTVGYFRGWVDEVVGRIIEALLSIPVILLAIMVLTTLGKSQTVIILTIAVLFIPVVTRTVRSAVLAEAQLDYVTSAKLRGEGAFFIMTREILPNVTGVGVVELTVRIGYAIFTVATLSFLGLNAGDSSKADWGRDLGKQYDTIQAGQWWASIFPALAIAFLVIGVNLVADSLDRVNKS